MTRDDDDSRTARETWLLRRIAARESDVAAALRELQASYRRRFLGALYRACSDIELAKEVLGDLWVEVWQKAGEFDPAVCPPAAWLSGFCNNACKRARTLIARRLAVLEPADIGSRRKTPEAELMRDQERRCYQNAWARLAREEPEAAEFIQMRYTFDMTFEQIAERFRLQPGTIENKLVQARRKAHRFLKPCRELAVPPDDHDTMPPPDAPEDERSDSTREWFDRLGSRPHGPATSRAALEADALRKALDFDQDSLDNDPVFAAEMTAEAEARDWKALSDRLQLDASPAAAAPAAPAWWQRLGARSRRSRAWPAAALALTLVLGAVVVPVWIAEHGGGYDEPAPLRGEDDVRRVQVQRPRQAAERFAADLRGARLRPEIFRRERTYIVDIDVDAEALALATPAFTSAGVAPRTGFTRVEFEPR